MFAAPGGVRTLDGRSHDDAGDSSAIPTTSRRGDKTGHVNLSSGKFITSVESIHYLVQMPSNRRALP